LPFSNRKPRRNTGNVKFTAIVRKADGEYFGKEAIMGMNKKRVLIVDDDARSREIFAVHLRSMGFETFFAYNADDAFHALEEDPRIDLIITDVVMPFMDGFEFTQRLRDDPLSRDIPVIGTSAYYDWNKKDEDRELAVDGFVPKPVERETLMQEVARLVK
jgi:CheY-like chemotaxis protein